MPAYAEDDPQQLRFELEPLSPGAPSSEVAKQLMALLTDGDLTPGSRLPPERQLQADLGVGRSAVREALAALEILGIVTVRPGSGTYLRESTSELLPQTLSWGMMLTASHTGELLEVRRTLEVQTASVAAERATPDEIAKLREHLATMAAHLDEPAAFIEADILFHLQIALSARNTIVKDLLQSVRSLLRVWVERGLRSREQAEVALAEHSRVLDAIEAKSPSQARKAMMSHMTTAERRFQLASGEA